TFLVEERLGQLMTDDPSVISDSLAQYGDLITWIDRIDKYFCHDTVEEIVEAVCLAREYRTSLHCISKEVSGDFCEGIRARLVDKDFCRKFRNLEQGVAGQPIGSLKGVTKDMVDCYFAPLPTSEPELNLPTALRDELNVPTGALIEP
ncbi:hypothetical protein Tco_0030753, partial [Tanacetum coccineum]